MANKETAAVSTPFTQLTRKTVPASALAVAANSLFETNDDRIGVCSGDNESNIRSSDGNETAAAVPLPKRYRILTDIMGSEDHHGDMDFKVAGTVNGITAIQLDVKLPGGVHLDLLEESLLAAREGRLKILETILAAAPTPRATFKPQVRIITPQSSPSKAAVLLLMLLVFLSFFVFVFYCFFPVLAYFLVIISVVILITIITITTTTTTTTIITIFMCCLFAVT
jgi:hypothetical protein